MGDWLRSATIVAGGRRRVHRGTARARAAAALSLALLIAAGCGEERLAEPPTRTVSLDGSWLLLLDPDGVGRDAGWAGELTAGATPALAPAPAFAIAVPGALEDSPATALWDRAALKGYDGVAWYVRRFRAPPGAERAALALHFGQVNYACEAWLDGEPIGAHEGGYDAFAFDVTGRLAGDAEHVLVVMVVDPGSRPVLGWTLKTTPHAKESWYHNWGGLLGPVSLRVHDHPAVTRLSVRTAGDAEAWVTLDVVAPPGHGPRAGVGLRVDGGPLVALSVALEQGRGHAVRRLVVEGPRRWSPENPQLHEVAAWIDGRPGPAATFGFRTVTIEDGDLLLDGRRRVAKGVLLQPHDTGSLGRTPSPEELDAEVAAILASGFDLVRAHVRPAPEAFLDACDRRGLMVLQEPAIGWVEDDGALLERCKRELDWMVERDRHHPSIVMWGVLNELSGKAYRHAEALADHLAALDPSRPVLEDSGGIGGGGRWRAPGTGVRAPMRDDHVYPPYPLPASQRDRLLGLGAGESGPVFVSEYGYGGMLDAIGVSAGFRERGQHGEEAALFESLAQVQQRCWAAGEGWRHDGWIDAGNEVSAQAAEELTELLRANRAVDLLCYTQWRAVSIEGSAGLLDPWGGSRPARERIAHALRPLMTTVVLPRPSVRAGEDAEARVFVVNETGAPLSAHVDVVVSAGEAALSARLEALDLPPGVTGLTTALPLAALGVTGPVDVTAELIVGGRPVDVSTPRTVRVVAPAPAVRTRDGGPAPLVVWVPDGDGDALAFLRREGLAARGGDGPADVALIARPERLRADVGLAEWLDLWDWVWRGGEALVMLPDPARRPAVSMLGARRVVVGLADLPVPTQVAVAAGHFLGTFHVLAAPAGGDDVTPGLPAPGAVDEVRMLERGDEPLSPVSMLVDEPAGDHLVGCVTLNSLGGALGSPLVRLPFGAGGLTCVGLPLLEPAASDADPRRDALLARLCGQLPRETPAGLTPAPSPAPRAVLDALRLANDVTGWVVDLGSRASPLAVGPGSGPRLPAAAVDALARRNAALEAHLEGRHEEAVAALVGLVAEHWSESLVNFVGRERALVDALGARLEAGVGADAAEVHAAIEAWMEAVREHFAGREAEAARALAEAERRLAATAGSARRG